MIQIENIRKLIGLKQADLATCLGVSAPLLAMIGTGKRNPPLGFIARLDKLNQLCQSASQKETDAAQINRLALHQMETVKALRAHAILCKKKGQALKNNLKKMQEVLAQTQTASKLEANQKPIEEIETPELILEICRRRALESLANNQIQAIEFLKLEIALCEFEELKSLEMADLFVC